MSLINQMLQDLDARRAAHGVGARLPNDVRPLPVSQSSRWPLLLAGLVLFVLLGGLAIYQWTMPPPMPSAPPVVALAPVVLPVPVPEPEKIAPPESPPSPEPAPEPDPDPALSLQGLEGSLRMTDFLAPPVDRKAGTKPAAAAPAKREPVDKKAAEPAASERSAPPSLPVLAPLPAPSLKAPSIERTESVGSPRERAESEYRKAIVAVNQGRVSESLDSLRNALRQDGLHVASRQLLVKLLLEAKQSDEALQVLQEGLQGQPAQLGWAMSLARLQVDRGDLAASWQTLNYSLPAAGSHADYQGFAAHVLQRLGRHKDAAERYQAAARLAPGDGRWWLGLGLAWEAEGRSGDAREAFARARQSGNLSAELTAVIEQKLK